MNEHKLIFDFTPDPNVLIALTHTAILPLDALCELIDNCIDSFQYATLSGLKIENPIILIDLPKPSELSRREGLIRIRDNGPGLTPEMAEKIIRAGYSSKNKFDSLGLFGMGFNISTGKLGRVTKLYTARKEESQATEVTIDLAEITRTGKYELEGYRTSKRDGVEQGTVIEVSGWWPEGNSNSQFVKRLVQYGLPTIRTEIGRRYATLLRDKKIRIVVNNEPCEAFHHCVWNEARTVERRGWGQIPAVIRFDKVIYNQKKCSNCGSEIISEMDECPSCESSSIRTVEERISGWIGIQRFDDSTNYGIDIIRNGRSIRIAEKSAFFEFVDEFKKTIYDYPADQNYGRIVGEVHLNHVPVDFLKQDFMRTSPEWLRAMVFLRGESSLQPKQPNADRNESPMFRLYQGYRRVRNFGKADMYMGYYDAETNEPKRISRDIEREFYAKFLKKIPGYFDDTEWWKLVEQATTPPIQELPECPSCGAQNLKERDTCEVCGDILIPKNCINPDCNSEIPKSALSCPICGVSQVPKIEDPWTCFVCSTKNIAGNTTCSHCGNDRNSENVLSRDYLLKNANKSDELSMPGCSILLADGSYSSPIAVNTYITVNPIIPFNQTEGIPLVVFKGEEIDIFIDKAHKAFRAFRLRPEQMIAAEVALYIYDMNRQLTVKQYQGQHTLTNLEWQILKSKWSEVLEDNPEKIRADINSFFDSVKERLPLLFGSLISDIFDDLTEEEKKNLVINMLGKEDISRIGEMRMDGTYLKYLDEEIIAGLFNKYPEKFFDGNLWTTPYTGISGLPDTVLAPIQSRIKQTFGNCLSDISGFARDRSPEPGISQRARMSLDYLLQKVAK
ncbi:ATP-binding protein [Bacillus sp. 3255]|uniref:ATP-binding protein n=1 Tax=Bacillus sp. 3255 TaxID=2817904 RepID=UPI0028648B79|nr:ATP-binding protein [Bacillus sp. 3255]MDR6884313.1 ribosomal protein S27AE [Bacillus sp. 3255]